MTIRPGSRLFLFLVIVWSAACLTGGSVAVCAQAPTAAPASGQRAPAQPLPYPNPLADNALRPRIIPAAPSAYESAPKGSLTTWVAKVNGDPISVRFLTRRLAANRSAVYRHFADKTGATPGAEFWMTNYDGETPRQWLQRRALEECVRLQVELGSGKRHGLLPDTSYAGFLKALDRENVRRRTALAKGEPIYGPQQYGEDEFFTYVMNNLRLTLQQRLGEGELKPSAEALQKLYESVKPQYFDRGYRVKVWAIEIIAGNRAGYAKSYTPEEALARITEATQRLEKGESFEQVAAAYNENGELHEQVFDYESRSGDKARASVREEAMRLSEGQVSGVIHEMNTFSILKCLEKDPLGYRPFDEVKDQLVLLSVRQQYEALVSRLVKSATIKVNQAELDRIEIK